VKKKKKKTTMEKKPRDKEKKYWCPPRYEERLAFTRDPENQDGGIGAALRRKGKRDGSRCTSRMRGVKEAD